MKEFVEIFAREKILQQILIELNNFTELKQSLDVVIKYIKLLTSCEAIAIRLKNNNDYPYYTYDGFSENFIQKENDIRSYNEDGSLCLDENGVCSLVCMCGVVLSGKTEAEYRVFTPGGSFWTNNSTTLVRLISKEAFSKFKVRGYCNICGYESVAIIPIRYNGSIIGTVQMNDHESDKFTYELINYMEMVGIQIGISIRNRKIYSDLLYKYNRLLGEGGADCG